LAAICRAAHVDRYRIRQAFEQRFAAAVMAKKYLAIYEASLVAAKAA
jgi:hypothetical protein